MKICDRQDRWMHGFWWNFSLVVSAFLSNKGINNSWNVGWLQFYVTHNESCKVAYTQKGNIKNSWEFYWYSLGTDSQQKIYRLKKFYFGLGFYTSVISLKHSSYLKNVSILIKLKILSYLFKLWTPNQEFFYYLTHQKRLKLARWKEKSRGTNKN